MRILLVNTNRVRPPIGPLALDYIGAAVRGEGHEVDLLDLCWSGDALTAIAEAFASGRVDLAAVTFRNTDDCYFASGCSFVPVLRRDIAMIREHFDGPVILGGSGFSLMPIRLLEEVDVPYGARGDGEVTLPALARVLMGADSALSGVPGLVYKADGAWRRNAPAQLDLSAVSLAQRDVIDNRRYFREGGQAGVETKRGCPGRCIYCADPVIRGRQLRLRPPVDVVSEIRNLLEQGADHLHLCDSEFNLPETHAAHICRALVDAGLGERVRWHTYASPAPFSSDLAMLMRRAGCVGVNFGVDSGSDRMLSALGREFAAVDIGKAVEACRQAGLTVMFDLLLGAPGETWETVAETIELMKVLSPDCVGISVGVRVYPGTPLEARLTKGEEERHGLTGDPSGVAPAFYLSPYLGDDPYPRIREMIGGDERFFLPFGGDERDYNYNENQVLQSAIDAGERGAYWEILRQIKVASLAVGAAGAPGSGTDDTYRHVHFVEHFSIRADPFSRQPVLHAAGWCFHPCRREPAIIRLMCDGVLADEIRCEIVREDVAGIHASAAPASSLPICGFRYDGYLPLGTGSCVLLEPDGFVMARGGDDELAECDQFDTTALGSPQDRPPSDRVPAVRPVLARQGAGTCARPLNALLFTHNLGVEGAPKVLVELARGLAARGCVRTKIVTFADGPLREVLEGNAIPVHPLVLSAGANVPAGWSDADDYEDALLKVVSLLERERPDVVVANTVNLFFVVEASSRLGIPSLWLIHEHYGAAALERNVTSRFLAKCEAAFPEAARVVFVSEATRDLYRQQGVCGDFVVVPNRLERSVVVAEGDTTSRIADRKALGIDPDCMVVLAVGTVCARKNQETLIRAAARLAETRRDFQVYVVGAREGEPYVRYVRRLVAEASLEEMIFVVPETSDVDRYYRASDVFVCTSLNESYPLTILEAMAHGLPIVTTICGGVGEQVRFGTNALGFKCWNVESLARHLEVLLENSVQRHRMGRCSRDIFKSLSNHDSMLDTYEALLTGACRSG